MGLLTSCLFDFIAAIPSSCTLFLCKPLTWSSLLSSYSLSGPQQSGSCIIVQHLLLEGWSACVSTAEMDTVLHLLKFSGRQLTSLSLQWVMLSIISCGMPLHFPLDPRSSISVFLLLPSESQDSSCSQQRELYHVFVDSFQEVVQSLGQ